MTPTCLTSQTRSRDKPHRKPTPISSRALAYFLATQDDPCAGLCPHPLRVSPSSLEYDPSKSHIYLPKNPQDLVNQAVDVIDTSDSSKSQDSTINHAKEASPASELQGSKANRGTKSEDGPFWASILGQKQVRKDKRSLTQNLFDTIALIHFYWKKIPDVNYSEEPNLQSGPASASKEFSLKVSADVKLNGRSSRLNGHKDAVKSQGNGLINGENVYHIAPPSRSYPTLPIPSGREQEPSVTDSFVDDLIRPDVKKQKLSDVAKSLVYTNGHKHGALNGIASEQETAGEIPSSNGIEDIPLATPHTRGAELSLHEKLDEAQDDRSCLLSCEALNKLRYKTERGYRWSKYVEQVSTPMLCDYDRRTHPAIPSSARHFIYQVLSNPELLIRSFRDEEWPECGNSPLPHLNPSLLDQAFRHWVQSNGPLILDSLWIALEALFRPPPEISTLQKSPRLRPANKSPTKGEFGQPSSRSYQHTGMSGNIWQQFDNWDQDGSGKPYLSDADAAHLIMICIHALASLSPRSKHPQWVGLRSLHAHGIFLPTAVRDQVPLVSIVDAFEYEPAIRLAERLMRGIAARRCFSEILENLSDHSFSDTRRPRNKPFGVMDIICRHLQQVEAEAYKTEELEEKTRTREADWSVTLVFRDWLRILAIKRWDHDRVINRWTAVGGALEILEDLRKESHVLIIILANP